MVSLDAWEGTLNIVTRIMLAIVAVGLEAWTLGICEMLCEGEFESNECLGCIVSWFPIVYELALLYTFD